jgi:hypothetical protein
LPEIADRDLTRQTHVGELLTVMLAALPFRLKSATARALLPLMVFDQT